jgi:DNA-binding NarL/FixJ family response regulator
MGEAGSMGEAGGVVGVVIVDDHRMFAESLARLLTDVEGIAILGVAGTGAEAIDIVARVLPRVVLMDYELPDLDGVAVTVAIRARNPEIMVVMLTGHSDERLMIEAIDAGCAGFLTKDRAAAEVADAVRGAAAGEALVSPEVLHRLLPQLDRRTRSLGGDLSEREREILVLLARGWTNKAIATELFLSVNTVRNHVQSVLNKLGSHSKLEAVTTAVREGIIDYPRSA